VKIAYISAARAVELEPSTIPAGCAIAIRIGEFTAVIGPAAVGLCGELRGKAAQPLTGGQIDGLYAQVAPCTRAGLAGLVRLLTNMATAAPTVVRT
jgi:hypothetical protein